MFRCVSVESEYIHIVVGICLSGRHVIFDEQCVKQLVEVPLNVVKLCRSWLE